AYGGRKLRAHGRSLPINRVDGETRNGPQAARITLIFHGVWFIDRHDGLPSRRSWRRNGEEQSGRAVLHRALVEQLLAHNVERGRSGGSARDVGPASGNLAPVLVGRDRLQRRRDGTLREAGFERRGHGGFERLA